MPAVEQRACRRAVRKSRSKIEVRRRSARRIAIQLANARERIASDPYSNAATLGAMVYAPGAGRGPLPIPVAIAFVLVGPLLLWFAFKAATSEPKPKILTCSRERADVIVCDPGNVRGPRAIARRQSGKNAQTCFTLGDAWMTCGGNVDGAAAQVNALPVGAKTDVDLTPPRASGLGLWTGAALAVVMILAGLHRLFGFGNIRKSSKR